MWVRTLAEAGEDTGAKAHGLARAIAAGLRVPDGFVVEPAAFRSVVVPGGLGDVGHQLAAAEARLADAAPPPACADEIAARAAALGVIAVRSSASLEDRATGAAPGVFASVVGVDASDVWPAIRTVWASALAAVAAAYARGRPFEMAVIVQRYVPGSHATVYTRAPGAPTGDALWIQRDGGATPALVRTTRADPDPLAVAALAAEHAIGATAGADVELVRSGDDAPWIVQARPIVHPAELRQAPPPPVIFAALVADGRTWTWDVAHNPDPLSTAQTELVDRVEAAGFAPWSLRVCGGYLYSAPRSPAPRPSDLVPANVSVEQLGVQAARIERDFAKILDDGIRDLDAAIAAYLAFYRRWSTELVPLLRVARAAPEVAFDARGARPSAVDATLIAAARGELDEAAVHARIGVMSPAWDVAVPTFAEDPARIERAIDHARLIAKPTRNASIVNEITRLALDLGERDDIWFARAQWLVRRAILARAAEIGLSDDDAFWISFDELRSSSDLDSLRRHAAAARTAASRAARWSMPLVVGGVAPDVSRACLVGVGSGGRASGRVVRIDSLANIPASVTRADVLVTRAITPALAVIVIGCAAIISETGGPLDHGAAMARELGIPCVVGCRDAWTLLSDGMLVTVDGDEGVVTR